MRSIGKRLAFNGGKLFLCDMRPGFSEDGVEVWLPKGDYQLCIEPIPDQPRRGFSLVLAGQRPDKELLVGTFTVDMARIGLFDRSAFSKLFAGDGEALFDWSGDISGKRKSKWGGFLKHKPSGLEALYVSIGLDCTCAVQLLRSGSRTVGVRIVPQASPRLTATDERGSRHWTWVELKCQGIGDPWSFCDDRDYEPDFDLLLDNVSFNVRCYSTDGLDAKIDPDIAISRYAPRYRGVSKVSMFYERAGEGRQPVRLPQSNSIAKLGSKATPRKVAKIVFDLFKLGRLLG